MGKIEDIITKLIELGDSISIIGSDSDFAKAAKTANMDFYKFRNEIVGLVRYGVRPGYTVPATCGMEVRSTEKEDEFTVTIDVFFLIEGDKLQKISKQYTVFGFSYLPDSIKGMLKENGLAKITFGSEELQDIIVNMEKEVFDSRNRSLLYWVNKTIKSNSVNGCVRYRVKLDDMVLYYRARIYALIPNKELYLTDFMVAHLVDIDNLVEKTDLDALHHSKTICFDVTKS